MDAGGGEGGGRQAAGRSWVDRISERPKTVAAVCVLVLLVGAWFFVDALGRQRLRRAERAIIARGEPITVDDLRKRLPTIPDDENMAVGLAEHGAKIRVVDSANPTNSTSLPILSNAKPVAIGVRWPPEQEAAAQWFCETNAGAIEGIDAASNLSNGLYPIKWASPAINILLSHLSLHRTIVKSLAVAALAAAHNGRPSECVRYLAVATATDRAIRHEPFVISLLVRIACTSLTCDTALRCVSLTCFTEAQLAALDRSIESVAGGIGLRDACFAERVMVLDTIVWAYRGGNLAGLRSTGSPAAPAATLLRIAPAMRGVDPAIYLEHMARMCDAAALSPPNALAEIDKIDQSVAGLPFYAIATKILMPSLSRAVALWHRSRATTAATRAALAAERYRLRHGHWPDELREIVPEYLPSAAILDPFSGKPLVYHRDVDGIRIYSVGEDGIDDGGVMERERNTPQRRIFDPGVFLPNPDRRNLAASTQHSEK